MTAGSLRFLPALALASAATASTAGCDRWGECHPDSLWAVEAVRVAGYVEDEGADIFAGPGPDGAVLVVLSDYQAIRFGGQELRGPHLARIDRDGVVDRVVAETQAGDNPSPVGLGADDAGGTVVAWVPDRVPFSLLLVAYDAALAPRWSFDIASATDLDHPFDVGPEGHVAFVSRDAEQREITLHYLGPDGVERWRQDLSSTYVRSIRLNAEGDVMGYGHLREGEPRRWRHAANDGAIVEDAAAIDLGYSSPIHFARSGEIAAAAHVPGTGLEVSLLDDQGRTRWTRVLDLGSPVQITRDPSGHIILLAYPTQSSRIAGVALDAISIVRLDGSIGEPLAAAEYCGTRRLAAVDDDGYVIVGPIGSPSEGLVRYPPLD